MLDQYSFGEFPFWDTWSSILQGKDVIGPKTRLEIQIGVCEESLDIKSYCSSSPRPNESASNYNL